MCRIMIDIYIIETDYERNKCRKAQGSNKHIYLPKKCINIPHVVPNFSIHQNYFENNVCMTFRNDNSADNSK